MVDGLNTSTFAPSELIAGEFDRAQRVVSLTGAVALLAGSVLGRFLSGAAAVAAAVPGNTGNGVCGAVVCSAGVREGIYKIVFIEPGANVGTFTVEDPRGVQIGQGNVGVAFNKGGLAFTIADGAADFISGDSFTITVTNGVEKFKLSTLAATDGSEEPVAILSQDADVTAGDKQVSVYLTGEFRKTALTFGAGHTAASTSWALAQKKIFLRDTVA